MTAPRPDESAADLRARWDQLPAWQQRFLAPRVFLPDWAEHAPDRCVLTSDLSGTTEVYAWDAATGSLRQATARRNGTATGAIDPEGARVWWFDDTDGDEFGFWRSQRFEGGPDEEVAPGLAASYPAGLALGRAGLMALGCAVEGQTSIYTGRRGEAAETLTLAYQHAEDAGVGDLSRDGSLLAISHSEHGDSRHPALRVLRLDGERIADLWDGPGKGLEVLGFAPLDGDTRLLVGHERRGRPELLIWDVATGEQRELDLGLPGEVEAEWYPDGAALLVVHSHQARSTLHRYQLASGELTDLLTDAGTIADATARPDGQVWVRFTSGAHPSTVRTLTGEPVLQVPGPKAPPSVPNEDIWVDGPGGRIHALLARPAASAGSSADADAGALPADHALPAVFLVHGGPTWHDADAFDPMTAAWVDHGFAVVRVNYRGSTGYGSAWRDALEERVGFTELADVRAVRDRLVADGVVDPARLVLAGGSWGGFLTLLGLGTQPDAWSVGVAAVPVADYVAAYEDEMEGLQAFDRSLFGGSPEQVPDKYRDSSPLTYVDAVRAPVLVLAGANDPRCPLRQIENYLARLDELGAPHDVYRFDAGHGSLVLAERLRQAQAEIDFARRTLGLAG